MVSEEEDVELIKSAYEQLKHDFVFLQQQVNASQDKAARLEEELARVDWADLHPAQAEVRRLFAEVKQAEALADSESAIADQTELQFLNAQALVDEETQMMEAAEKSEKIESDAAKC